MTSLILAPCAAVGAQGSEPWPSLEAFHAKQRELSHLTHTLQDVMALHNQLESHEGPLSGLETQLLMGLESRYGIEPASKKLGMGLEAYQGSRYRMVSSVSLEGFQDFWRAIVEKIVKVYNWILDWIKKLFRMHEKANETLLEFYKRYQPGVKHIAYTEDVNSNAVRAATMFMIDGKFDASTIFARYLAVVQGLSFPPYHNASIGFTDTALRTLSAAKKALDKNDPKLPWQNELSRLVHSPIPVPGGVQGLSSGTAVFRVVPFAQIPGMSIYASEALAGGHQLIFQLPSFDLGQRITGTDVESAVNAFLTVIGKAAFHPNRETDFAVAKDGSSHPVVADLSLVGRAGVDAPVPTIIQMLEAAKASNALFERSGKQYKQVRDALQAFVHETPKAELPYLPTLTLIIRAVEALNSCQVQVHSDMAESVYRAAKAYVNVLMLDLA